MKTVEEMIQELRSYDGEAVTFMEVCGTHTGAIASMGLKSLLSSKITLVSGPGCPVCVTMPEYIDTLCYLAKKENTCVVSFGDMFRVPGTKQCLKEAMAEGGRVVMIYSPFEVLTMAREHPETTYVVAAVGFETTTPIYALMLKEIMEYNITNLKLLTSLRTMPKAIGYICKENPSIKGFIAPGHVCTITGSNQYVELAKDYGVPFVVAGFTEEQIISALYLLIKKTDSPKVYNLYQEVVTEEGNEVAKKWVDLFFEPCDMGWRGIGTLPGSGLKLRKKYRQFTIDRMLKHIESSDYLIKAGEDEDKSLELGCICSQILLGKAVPSDCVLYQKGSCTLEHPVGACMVSQEGSCNCYKRGAV